MPSFDTLVIGGGLAGITASVALANAGRRIALLEGSSRLGGRASSSIDATTGDAIAIGPHVLFSEYDNMLRLLRLLGTEWKVIWDRSRFSTEVLGTRELVTRMSWLPAPFHFVPSLMADPTLRARDWLSNAGVTLFALSLRDDELLALDDTRGIDILRRLRVSEPYIDRFWRYLAIAIVNVPLEQCSAATLLRAYRRLIGKRGYRVGYPDGGLGDLFAPAAERFLRDRGSLVLTNARVTSLDDGFRATLASGETFDAKACVVALPPRETRALLPDAMAHDLGAVPYVSVYLWFDRKLTTLPFWSRVYDARDLNLDFYDFSNIGARGGTSLIGSNIIGAERIGNRSDDEIVRVTMQELEEFLPHARDARLVHSVVHRIPMAIHAAIPGSEHARPRTIEPRPGLVLAGDWLQTGLPASMESACSSGWRAAETILGTRGLAIEHRELDPIAAMLGFVTRTLRRFVQRSRN
jgi:15-cis-phytoene desaturase